MSKSKKIAALILILMVFSGTALAQKEEEDDEPHGLYLEKPRVFYGGVIAGANFCQVDGDYYAGYHKIALNAGGIVYAQLARHVALSLEILYAQKGSKSNGAQFAPIINPPLTLKYYINANYAEIPVMINYFDRRKSHFGIGLSYSRLVNVNESVTTDSQSVTKTVDLASLYPFKKDDLDFVAGAQLHLIKGLFLNIRFQYSITPIRSGANLPPPEYARAAQYNNLWVVRLMYLVNGK